MQRTILRLLSAFLGVIGTLILIAAVVSPAAPADTTVPPTTTTTVQEDTGTPDSGTADAPGTTTTTTTTPPTTTTTPTTTTPPPTTTTTTTTKPPAGTATVVVTAVDANTAQPVAGVVVSVGSTRAATPATVTVPAGRFGVTVVDVPARYRLDGHGFRSGDVAVGQTAQVSFRLVKQPAAGSGLVVHKKDRISGEPLAGANFVLLRCHDGAVGGSLTTAGHDGIGTVAVAPGCYDVVERTAPAGYLLDRTPRRVEVPRGWFTELTVYDLPVDYVVPRDPGKRVPIQSIPSGRVS